MTLKGRAHKLGDNVSTDIHAANKYKPLGITLEELVQQLFVELDPELPQRVRPGDILVAGEYFGMVSSREDAVAVMKAAGFQAVLAKSYGHLFYHNAINLGLAALECDTAGIETGDWRWTPAPGRLSTSAEAPPSRPRCSLRPSNSSSPMAG